jgi:exopolysaccharide biosynthesis protein
MTVTLDSEKPITGLYIPEGTNSLVLDSAEIKQIAQGVTYEEHLYLDANGKPVRAYIMTIEKGAATIATCLPNDEMKVGPLANIKKQVTAARNNGQNVIAGINADFFNVYPVEGLCIKDGVVLHGTGGRQWFGITKDGEAVIGEGTEYSRYEGKLITAVGGSNIVIHQDYVTNISIDHEWGYTRHPRTAVGIKHDGSVVFMVVDGRQPSISNGAALADLADILGSLGCCKAINLDGGGSSTFVLLDENENFQTMNSPSDETGLRAVADGLMVILP